jgi:hypothetical protein
LVLVSKIAGYVSKVLNRSDHACKDISQEKVPEADNSKRRDKNLKKSFCNLLSCPKIKAMEGLDANENE